MQEVDRMVRFQKMGWTPAKFVQWRNGFKPENSVSHLHHITPLQHVYSVGERTWPQFGIKKDIHWKVKHYSVNYRVRKNVNINTCVFRLLPLVDDMDAHINDELKNELDARIKDRFKVLNKMIDNMHQNYAEILRRDLLQHPTTRNVVTELGTTWSSNATFQCTNPTKPCTTPSRHLCADRPDGVSRNSSRTVDRHTAQTKRPLSWPTKTFEKKQKIWNYIPDLTRPLKSLHTTKLPTEPYSAISRRVILLTRSQTPLMHSLTKTAEKIQLSNWSG